MRWRSLSSERSGVRIYRVGAARLGLAIRAAVAALLVASCGDPADPPADPRMQAGREVFTQAAQPTCSTCHTLKDAGASGVIGPNLDQLKPDPQRVAAAVTNGVGVMPAQGGNLTEEQIQDVAYYVSRVTGGADPGAR